MQTVHYWFECPTWPSQQQAKNKVHSWMLLCLPCTKCMLWVCTGILHIVQHNLQLWRKEMAMLVREDAAQQPYVQLLPTQCRPCSPDWRLSACTDLPTLAEGTAQWDSITPLRSHTL